MLFAIEEERYVGMEDTERLSDCVGTVGGDKHLVLLAALGLGGYLTEDWDGECSLDIGFASQLGIEE